MLTQLFAVILLFAATAAPQQAQVAAPPSQGASQQSVRRIRVSGDVMSAKLLRPVVAPIYPALAATARIQGTVRFSAVIGTDGRVVSLKVISGHPLLIKPALDAVQQWRYQPTLLNGKPVEVQTQINVIFALPCGPLSRRKRRILMPAAQQQAAERSTETATLASVDPTTAAEIRQLLDLTATRHVLSQVFPVVLAQVKEQLAPAISNDPRENEIATQLAQKINEHVNTDADFYDFIIPVYAKHFTDAEIKEALAFYESPTGRKFVSQQTSLEQDFQGALMIHWKLVVVPEIVKELSKQFPEIKKRVKYTRLPPGPNQ